MSPLALSIPVNTIATNATSNPISEHSKELIGFDRHNISVEGHITKMCIILQGSHRASLHVTAAAHNAGRHRGKRVSPCETPRRLLWNLGVLMFPVVVVSVTLLYPENKTGWTQRGRQPTWDDTTSVEVWSKLACSTHWSPCMPASIKFTNACESEDLASEP